MGRPIDLVIGAIHDMNDDRLSGWSAYIAADTERERLEDRDKKNSKLIKELREEIRRLKGGRKIKG
jgi:hypothetical protein